MSRLDWDALMSRAQPSDVFVVVWLDRFSRNLDEDVWIQAGLTSRKIGIVAIREGVDTTDDSVAAKYFCRMMMAHGGVDSGKGQNRTLTSLSALWLPIFAGEQDVGPPNG